MKAYSRFERFVVAFSVAILIVFAHDNMAILSLFAYFVDGLQRMWADRNARETLMRFSKYVMTAS